MDYAKLQDILEEYLAKGYYPSAVCRVFDLRRTLWCCAVGDAQMGTWYDLASVSKIVCTTMLLTLMDEGVLSPETRVLSVLPADAPGPVTRERLSQTTVRQLMTHTSGIVPWYPFYCDGRPFFTVLEHVLASTPPEEGVAYSDLNFMLCGQIFSHLSGMTLREGLEAILRRRLGIRDIAYGPVDASLCAPCCYDNRIEKRMCAERGLSFDGWRPDGVPVLGECNDGNAFYYWGGASGHAGVFSTAEALEELCRFYLTTDSPVFIDAMREHAPERGLGFDMSFTYPDGCGHSGFTGTGLWISREHGIGAVLLANRLAFPDGHTTGNMNEVRRALFYALLGRTPPCVTANTPAPARP